MSRRVGPWLFGAAFAVILLALGIHRYSWQYEAILAGLLLVALATKLIRISLGGDEDGSGEEPAGEGTHEHSLGPFSIRVEREPSPSDANVEQVLKEAPGRDSGRAEGNG